MHYIRTATINDSAIILEFIKELASYENLINEVTGSEIDIKKTLFCDNPKAFALILEEADVKVGFAIYFYNYSTFLCKHGIYIEDIYIREKYRGKNYGKEIFKYICNEAINNNCGRVEWWCLDWNKKSIEFYLNLGAEAMNEWTVFRLNENQINQIAKL